MNKLIMFLMVFMLSSASAHEMTPTYPKWKYSAFDGVLETTMEMFNKREDVDYYEIGVFDEEWNPIPFVSSYKLIKLRYLGHVKFKIYIKAQDRDRVEYVCSRSRLRKKDHQRTVVSSKICSKFR